MKFKIVSKEKRKVTVNFDSDLPYLIRREILFTPNPFIRKATINSNNENIGYLYIICFKYDAYNEK